MNQELECAREGNRELARFLGVSLRTVCRYIPEMKDAGAVVRRLKGIPPRPVNFWWPSLVQRFCAIKQLKEKARKEAESKHK